MIFLLLFIRIDVYEDVLCSTANSNERGISCDHLLEGNLSAVITSRINKFTVL